MPDMTDPHPLKRVHLTRVGASWWLLLTVPLALMLSYFLLIIITLAWCGVSGCSGGGFGRVSDPDEVLAIGASLVSGVIWFGAIGAVPWLGPRRARLVVAAIIALVIALLMLLVGTGGFIRG